jgi:hypothetical protein
LRCDFSSPQAHSGLNFRECSGLGADWSPQVRRIGAPMNPLANISILLEVIDDVRQKPNSLFLKLTIRTRSTYRKPEQHLRNSRREPLLEVHCHFLQYFILIQPLLDY